MAGSGFSKNAIKQELSNLANGIDFGRLINGGLKHFGHPLWAKGVEHEKLAKAEIGEMVRDIMKAVRICLNSPEDPSREQVISAATDVKIRLIASEKHRDAIFLVLSKLEQQLNLALRESTVLPQTEILLDELINSHFQELEMAERTLFSGAIETAIASGDNLNQVLHNIQTAEDTLKEGEEESYCLKRIHEIAEVARKWARETLKNQELLTMID